MSLHPPASLSSAIVLAVLMASPLRAEEASFSFEPPAPLATESVKVRVTYLSNCFTGLGRAAVAGNTIRLTAFEGCVCPEILPFPVEVATTVGPLAPDGYEVSLATAPDPRDPECSFQPVEQGSAQLAVAKGGLVVALDPPLPTTGDDVTVKVLSSCPAAFELPSRAGNLIRVTEVPSPIRAPCSDAPGWPSDIALGKLPAGDYSLVFTFDDGQEPPRVTHNSSFQVSAASGSELLLHEGRFRVTARWERPSAAGKAQAVVLLPDAGVFSFPRPANVQLLVRVLDACGSAGHYRVFASGATRAGVELAVEDTFTGAVRTYSSPVGAAFEPVFDTRAFPCDG